MSIRRKIHLVLAAGFCLTLLLVITGATVSSSAASQLEAIVNGHARSTESALEVQHLATRLQSLERAMVVRAVLADREGIEELERQYRPDRQTMERKAHAFRGLPTVSASSLASLDEMAPLLKAWLPLHDQILEAARKGDAAAAAQLNRSETLPLTNKIVGLTSSMVEVERAAMERASAATVDRMHQQRWFSIVLGVLGLAVLLFGVWTVRGSLTQLGISLTDLRRMADEVTQAAGSLSSTSQALADGATRQAASTEETASSSGEVKTMAQRNSDSAKQAATIVNVAQEKFDKANRSLVNLEGTMAGIGESSSKIARIIKVIDDIAFQTNILSLNAAVEAARAGDAGMGFAVVADEVRGLAQRCAKAAQETAELINESIARASEGKEAASAVAATIRSVTDETESIRALVTEVSEGSEQQARAMDEIATAVTQIERVTQDSAANAEEAAAASEELTAQSVELRHITDRITELAGVGAAQEASAGDGGRPDYAIRRAAPARPQTANPFALRSQTPSMSSSDLRTDTSISLADDDDRDFRPF